MHDTKCFNDVWHAEFLYAFECVLQACRFIFFTQTASTKWIGGNFDLKHSTCSWHFFLWWFPHHQGLLELQGLGHRSNSVRQLGHDQGLPSSQGIVAASKTSPSKKLQSKLKPEQTGSKLMLMNKGFTHIPCFLAGHSNC